MTIINFLEDNAKNKGNQTALVEIEALSKKKKEITWKEFDNLSNKIKDALLKLGIKKGDKISILMKNRIEWLPVYFGILKSAALVSPLNFRFSPKEIDFCLSLTKSKILFFEEEFIEHITKIKTSLDRNIQTYIFIGEKKRKPKFAICFDDFLKLKSEKKAPKISLYDNAAIYFTSGTTSMPKAVLLKHKNLQFAAKLENKHHMQDENDIFLCIPPLYHTGAKMHWFGNLVVGAKCVLLKGIDPKAIIEVISQEKITITWLLVPWIHDIIIAVESGKINLKEYELSQWEIMHSGAQPIPPSLIQKWLKIFPHHKYDTNYGLTETTGPGCVHLGFDNINKVGAIGKPGWMWEYKIIDKENYALPFGETGELIVKGKGVMEKYYKNPKETRKAIKNRWLHTGDMARCDKDGFIWLVDRKKDMIICGGENIYPVQIENFLIEHDKIHDVAVIGCSDTRLGEVVAAIIKVKENQSLCKEEVEEFCKKLPRYKRPKKIFFDDVPRNPTGKIEKPKLRRKYS